MLIKDTKMNGVHVVVRARDGDLLGVVFLKLQLLTDTGTYEVQEFLIEKPNRDVTTSEDYPFDTVEKIFDATIDFSCKYDRAEAIADIVKPFFPNIGVIIFNFDNTEIHEALGGEFIY